MNLARETSSVRVSGLIPGVRKITERPTTGHGDLACSLATAGSPATPDLKDLKEVDLELFALEQEGGWQWGGRERRN